MLDLKVGDSVKVLPLDTTVFEYTEPIIGKVYLVNSIKKEMILIGNQYDRLVGWTIPLTSDVFSIETTVIPAELSEDIDKYTKESFYKIPIKDIALSKYVYREVLTDSFGDVTVTDLKENKFNNLMYTFYEFKKTNRPYLHTLRVTVNGGDLVSEGIGEFKNDNLELAKRVHDELKVGQDLKVYIIVLRGVKIYSTNVEDDAKWFIYNLLTKDFVPDLSELEIFKNKI